MNDNLLLEFFRNEGDISEIYKVCESNDLFAYYNKMYQDERKQFHYIIKLLKSDSILNINEDEKVIVKRYEKLVHDLSNKCVNESLSEEEIRVYLSLLAYSMIDGYLENQEDIVRYLNKYYFNGTRYLIGEEHVLLLVNILNFINQAFNMHIGIFFKDFSNGDFASMNFEDVNLRLKLGETWYKDLIEQNQISEEDYYYLLYYEGFAILHEFYHANDLRESIELGIVHHEERKEKELVVQYNNPEFYVKYHENFKFESDANEFGLKYVDYLLKEIIPNDKFLVAKKRLLDDIAEAEKKKIDEEEFLFLLDREYDKIERERYKQEGGQRFDKWN